MENRNMEKLAREIYEWCRANDCWGDNIIYFDGKAWFNCSTWNGELGKEIGEDLYEYTGKNPLDYFEYANPDTLSMSFEGPLYDALNGYVRDWEITEEEFDAIFKKHGMYYEMGHAWNLAAYEL